MKSAWLGHMLHSGSVLCKYQGFKVSGTSTGPVRQTTSISITTTTPAASTTITTVRTTLIPKINPKPCKPSTLNRQCNPLPTLHRSLQRSLEGNETVVFDPVMQSPPCEWSKLDSLDVTLGRFPQKLLDQQV